MSHLGANLIVRQEGFEPPTSGLKVRTSTIELQALGVIGRNRTYMTGATSQRSAVELRTLGFCFAAKSAVVTVLVLWPGNW